MAENQVKLQNLTDKHKQVASLLAQGLGPKDITTMVDYTPEYVSWLCRDPLFKQYLSDMSVIAEARHEAMFNMTADVASDAMLYGTMKERIEGARMNLEVTGRLGKNERPNAGPDNSNERLLSLAERLTNLLGNAKGVTLDGQSTALTTVNP